jgi:hypothetical protein
MTTSDMKVFQPLRISDAVGARFYQCFGCKDEGPGIVLEIQSKQLARFDFPDEFDLVVTQSGPPDGWERIDLGPTRYVTDNYYCRKCAPIVREQVRLGLERALQLISDANQPSQQTAQ